MKHHILHNAASDSNRRAILLFAGWGMDEKPFTGLNAEGYDIIIIRDYREGKPSEALRTLIDRYSVYPWPLNSLSTIPRSLSPPA